MTIPLQDTLARQKPFMPYIRNTTGWDFRPTSRTTANRAPCACMPNPSTTNLTAFSNSFWYLRNLGILWYRLLQYYPARYFGNPEGLEGSEMKGFWTVASAHVLCLPSIVVQVFKVLTSSEKYVKIPENYFRKVRCFPKDSGRFRVVSGGRNICGGLPESSKSCMVL